MPVEQLHWIVDVDIIGESHSKVPQQLRALGHKVTTLTATRDFPDFNKYPSREPQIYVFHGSFEELNAVKKQIQVSTYGLGPSILRSHYTSYIPKDWFLNHNSLMTTWGNLESNSSLYDALGFSWPEVFIRPDSGYKIFTGQTINFETFKEDKAKLESVSSVLPETIIWVSSVKSIEAEYRVWISNKKVVAHTEYSWNDKPLSKELPEKVRILADKIAAYEWQVDRIYVVDIAMHRKEASIIEFNSFSCAGLYECDSEQLFKTISEDIVAEWNEE